MTHNPSTENATGFTLLEFLVGAVLLWVAGLFAYILFVMVPVMMYTEAECLRKGYPKYNVTIGLERYCSNLTGSVTVQVDKASK